MRQFFQIFFAVFVVMACSCSKERCGRYEIIDILPKGDNSGCAYSINQNGDVAGIYCEGNEGTYLFCWDAEKKTVIHGTELGFDKPVWIDNQRNIICQKFSKEFQKQLPFLWNPHKGLQYYIAQDRQNVLALGLNNHDEALLGFGDWVFFETAIWNITENKGVFCNERFLGSAINDKEILAGAIFTAPLPAARRSLSDRGTYKAAIFKDHKITIIDKTQKKWSKATDINEREDVVGWMTEGEKERAFIWSSDKGLRELGCIRDINTFFNGSHTKAHSINNKGQVVGWSTAGTVPGPLFWPFVFRDDGRAFYWDEQNGMVDLNELVSNMGDWERLVEAFSINDKGQIVGWGLKGCPSRRCPFLLNPIN